MGGGKGVSGDSVDTTAEVTPVAPTSPTPRNAETAQKAADDQRERVRRAMSSEKMLLSRSGFGSGDGSETLGAK